MLVFSRISICSLVLILWLGIGASGSESEKNVAEEELEAPNVITAQGEVSGKVIRSHGGRPVYSYLGMPYAKPPLGELRFSHPRRPESWTGVRDGTKDGSKCPQLTYPERNYEGDENCLFINVFTTRFGNNTRDLDVFTLNDVVVLIHDGGFSFGSGDSDAYCPDNLLDHDVVLVTFNYRLGALGFLSTGDEFAIGNYGLKDQVEALHWVHRNIIEFGGNPLSVTLLGTHAGGSSAHLHLLSQLSKDRFHGAISLSGTALSPWSLVDINTAKQRAEKVGDIVGCTKKEQKNSKLLIKCLRNKYTLDIVHAGPKIMEWSTDLSFPFVPVVEPYVQNMRPFLPRHPAEIMSTMTKASQGRFEKPWLIGVASHEGLPQALLAMVFPYIMNSLNTNPEKYIPLFLNMDLNDPIKSRTVGRLIWDFYVKNETLNYGNLNLLEQIVTDYNVFHGVFKSVSLQSKSNSEAPIFAYRFSYDRRTSLMSLGVPQGDDMEYIFPNIIATKKREYKDNERPAIERLTKIIANFAKHGDPTPEGSDLLGNDRLWPQATGESFEFVDIGSEFTIEEGFYQERILFWDEIENILEKPTAHDEL